MTKLFRVVMPVADLDRAVVFYSKVLGQQGTRVSPGRHYFDCEGTILACYDPAADGDAVEPRPIPEPVYIAVDDLEATFRVCQLAGAAFSSELVPDVGALGAIVERPWGEQSFYASDPFGNPLCFVSRDSMFRG